MSARTLHSYSPWTFEIRQLIWSSRDTETDGWCQLRMSAIRQACSLILSIAAAFEDVQPQQSERTRLSRASWPNDARQTHLRIERMRCRTRLTVPRKRADIAGRRAAYGRPQPSGVADSRDALPKINRLIDANGNASTLAYRRIPDRMLDPVHSSLIQLLRARGMLDGYRTVNYAARRYAYTQRYVAALLAEAVSRSAIASDWRGAFQVKRRRCDLSIVWRRRMEC
jgi:hypothetical protein